MLADVCRENLKAVTQAYAKATGRTRPQISKAFYGHIGFLDAFFSGEQSTSLDKLDAVFEKFAENWPPETHWPPLRAIVIHGPRRKIPKATVRDSANPVNDPDAATPRRRRR